jgi:hypothetical protein
MKPMKHEAHNITADSRREKTANFLHYAFLKEMVREKEEKISSAH